MSYTKEGCDKMFELFKLEFDKDFNESNRADFKKKILMFTELIEEREKFNGDCESLIFERNILLLTQLREVNEKLTKLSEEIKTIQRYDDACKYALQTCAATKKSKTCVTSDVQKFLFVKEVLMSSLAVLKDQLLKEFKLYNELVDMCKLQE